MRSQPDHTSGPLRKTAHFLVSLWGFIFVATWPLQEDYKSYLFVDMTLVWSGCFFLYVASKRLVEFWSWIREED